MNVSSECDRESDPVSEFRSQPRTQNYTCSQGSEYQSKTSYTSFLKFQLKY